MSAELRENFNSPVFSFFMDFILLIHSLKKKVLFTGFLKLKFLILKKNLILRFYNLEPSQKKL